jgi:hypothetical protein
VPNALQSIYRFPNASPCAQGGARRIPIHIACYAHQLLRTDAMSRECLYVLWLAETCKAMELLT